MVGGQNETEFNGEEWVMDQPEVAGKSPSVLELKAGKYWWCQCGRSKNQPFCDGSHAGTSFSPIEFELEEEKRVALCNCKHTASGPMCDGSHGKL